jgi:hypothetical protein
MYLISSFYQTPPVTDESFPHTVQTAIFIGADIGRRKSKTTGTVTPGLISILGRSHRMARQPLSMA